MKKVFALVILFSFVGSLSTKAQVGGRWYSYGEYVANAATTAGENSWYFPFLLWNDTTARFGDSTSVTYFINNWTSVGMSIAPRLSAWNDPSVYGTTIRVRPTDAFTIDSIRINGEYLRNFAKPLPKDTLRIALVYGNGTTTTNLPSNSVSAPTDLSDYGYDPLNFLEMFHDSLNNIAGRATGVVTAPYIQSIVLSAADTSRYFSKAYVLTTPYSVPAGNSASVSLSFKSGDASFTHFDTVLYTSGRAKYGTFHPFVEYVGDALGNPLYAFYNPADSNVGFFKREGYSDGGWGGMYIPTWAWRTSSGPSGLQFPAIDFHVICPTCPLTDTISGPATVCVGSTITLTTTATGGSWTSSIPGIASVGAGTGIVTGVSAGVVTISYTISGHSATKTVTVYPYSGASVTGLSSVCAGSSITLSGSPAGGTWSSTSTSVATVGFTSGIVHGVAGGTTLISYTATSLCGTVYGTKVVTVNPLPSAGAISGTSPICSGGTSSLSDGVSGGTWSSSSTFIATVNSSGTATGHAAGMAMISYSVTSGGCTGVATYPLTVEAPPSPGTITGLSTVCAGTSITFSDGVPGGTWSSSATAVATVNSSGQVTGVSGGTATITYTVANSCGTVYTTSNVSVSPLPDAGTVTGPADLCVGTATTLTDATPGGTWISANTYIATVSAGIVTGLHPGVDSIIYQVGNDCGTSDAGLLLTVRDCTGVGSVSAPGGAVSVFPNPTKNNISITAGMPIRKVVINNLLGQEMFSGSFNSKSVEVSLGGFPEGVYLVKVNDTHVSMVVKQ